MKRFRFSLATLLLVTTAAALFLGYARYRREFLKRETLALNHAGLYVLLDGDHYRPDGFWRATGILPVGVRYTPAIHIESACFSMPRVRPVGGCCCTHFYPFTTEALAIPRGSAARRTSGPQRCGTS